MTPEELAAQAAEEQAAAEAKAAEEAAAAKAAEEDEEPDYKALAEEKAAEAEKNAKAFEDQKKRAEKAEAKLKEQKPATKNGDELSSKDVLALSSAGITDEEDIEILQKAAKLNGTTIGAALKDSVVVGILKGNQEERKTATASSTGSSRRTQVERSPAGLVDNFNKGVMPDPKDIDAFVKAKIGIK